MIHGTTPNSNTPTAEAKTHSDFNALVGRLESVLAGREFSAVSELFVDDCYWRDIVSFTWNIKTFEGRPQIRDMLETQLEHVQPGSWQIDTDYPVVEAHDSSELWCHFETSAGRGYAQLRVVDGKIWTLLTTLQSLSGFCHQPTKHT